MRYLKSFLQSVLRFLKEADIFLLVVSLVSAIYGHRLIYSVASGGSAISVSILDVQTGAIVIGVALFIIFSYLDINIIADKSKLLYVFSVLFISILFFWGEGGGVDGEGSRAWLRFGDIGVQPAEVVKITFTIVIAKMITNYKERKTLNSFISLLKMLAVFAFLFSIILYIAGDMGTSLIYIFILVAMLFVGGVKLRWFALAGAATVIIAPFFWYYLLPVQYQMRLIAPFAPYRVDGVRREGFLWQPDLSVSAISSGGFTGQGRGSGRLTQAGTIPAQHTDFIFSVAGEELGFVGAIIIIVLLVIIISRCIYIGLQSNSPLGMLVCIGIATKFISQMIMNLGMALGILPVIGVTLPFFSYGGTSIVTSFAAMGIVSGIKMRPNPMRYKSF
jgi:rod shape determining protein RodA